VTLTRRVRVAPQSRLRQRPCSSACQYVTSNPRDLQSVQALRATHGIAPDDVASILATGSDVQVMLAEPIERKRAPSVAIDAKFSIPFTIAAAMIDREVTLDSFDAASLGDPGKLALAAKVGFERQADWGRKVCQPGQQGTNMDRPWSSAFLAR